MKKLRYYSAPIHRHHLSHRRMPSRHAFSYCERTLTSIDTPYTPSLIYLLLSYQSTLVCIAFISTSHECIPRLISVRIPSLSTPRSLSLSLSSSSFTSSIHLYSTHLLHHLFIYLFVYPSSVLTFHILPHPCASISHLPPLARAQSSVHSSSHLISLSVCLSLAHSLSISFAHPSLLHSFYSTFLSLHITSIYAESHAYSTSLFNFAPVSLSVSLSPFNQAFI
jgi:hypothetical protein